MTHITFNAIAARTVGDRKQEGADIRLQPAHGMARGAGRPKADDIFRRGNGCSYSSGVGVWGDATVALAAALWRSFRGRA